MNKLNTWDITKKALESIQPAPQFKEFLNWEADKQVDCLYHMIITARKNKSKLKLKEKVQIISDIKASLFDWSTKRAYTKWANTWKPEESPPETGNWVALRSLGSNREEVKFANKKHNVIGAHGVECTPESAVQLLCDELNRETA